MTGSQFSVRSGFVQLVALAVVVWATDVRGHNVDSATTPVANARVAAAQAMAGGVAQVSSGQSSSAPPAPAGASAGNRAADVGVSIRPCVKAMGTPGYAGRGSVIGPGGTSAGWNGNRPQLSPGHVLWTCEPLTQLVFEAYAGPDRPLLNTVGAMLNTVGGLLGGLPAPVRGGPSWAYTDAFTIEAKGESIAAATLAPLLRGLLEDRFQLKVRRVTEQQDMYVMTVATGGLNPKLLQTPTPGDCQTSDERRAAMAANPRPDPRTLPPVCGNNKLSASTNEVVFSGETLQQLAADLPSWNVGYFVIDHTGIESKFNFTMKAPNDPIFPPADPGWVIHGLEQMGLKLTRTKAPAEHLQIDHAEKPRLQ
jgi:uncharacterized protein (TIGR03435 family)